MLNLKMINQCNKLRKNDKIKITYINGRSEVKEFLSLGKCFLLDHRSENKGFNISIKVQEITDYKYPSKDDWMSYQIESIEVMEDLEVINKRKAKKVVNDSILKILDKRDISQQHNIYLLALESKLNIYELGRYGWNKKQWGKGGKDKEIQRLLKIVEERNMQKY